jgi:hypothetical protein
MLCLQRFKSGTKNNSKVEFPLEGLDMTPFLAEPYGDNIYDLYGIINHSGSL